APETNDTLVPGGQITLGGKDTENCDSTWTKVASTNRDNWSVTIHSFNILLTSGEVLNTGYDARDDIRAEISIASPLLTVPTDLHDQLVRELNATRNDELALYTVSCYDHPKIPSIVINIGSGLDSIYYTITPEQLISRE
ncbi:aspartic protease BmAsp-1identical, partial [Aphelenchoides avenae]